MDGNKLDFITIETRRSNRSFLSSLVAQSWENLLEIYLRISETDSQ
jgi:hypothetical protein